MSKWWMTVFVMLIALVAGGAVFLYFWEIPAPSEPVEIELDSERFPR